MGQKALSYAGVWTIPRPVNREEILQVIEDVLEGQGPAIIYLTGPGGIGKTYLLRDALRQVRPGGEWHRENLLPMNDPVDFYHTTVHTPIGLTRALRKGLDPALVRLKKLLSPAPFQTYDEALQTFEERKYDLAGMLRELSRLQVDALEAFLYDLNWLGRRKRIVLALDTAERLVYRPDPVQERLGWEPERIEVLPWLLEDFLPQVENAVVLIAGRPDPQLEAALREALGVRLRVHELDPFGEIDTVAYFDEVKRSLEEAAGKEDEEKADRLRRLAERVGEIPEQVRRTITHLTGGRPILLALMVDYLSTSDRLYPRILEPPDRARQWAVQEAEQARREVEADLVRFWKETGGAVEQVIEALAYARRGLDAPLLARILGTGTREAKALLTQVRPMAFVKVRPDDERFFLHDEMYELWDRHLSRHGPARERIYSAILEYYEEQILTQREEVRELWTPQQPGFPPEDEAPLGAPKPPDDSVRLSREKDRLYNLMAEEVYYRLRKAPEDGFRTYQLYAREAFWASEESLEYLLRSEMLVFLEQREQRGEPLPSGLQEEIAVDMALRRLERYNRRIDPQVPDLAQRLRTECTELLEEAGSLYLIHLDIREAEALVDLGQNLDYAETLLQRTIRLLKRLSLQNRRAWQRDILLADACNLMGYLRRTQGRFQEAVQSYNEAIQQWRLLEEAELDRLRRMALRAQHANTLNNQAWALAELGRFEIARRLCEDALRIRRELGPRGAVAFSENTLGMILIRDDKPHRARVHCQRALTTFRELENRRGVGMADIALSEALRRMSSLPDLYETEECADLLRQAERNATEAVEIFREAVPEHPRLVEALIERGCVYRQWAWLRYRRPYTYPSDPKWEELTTKSEGDLREAMEFSGEDIAYRRLDAHVNLAWLYYFVGQNDQADEEAQKAIGNISRAHGSPEEQVSPRSDLPRPFYWLLLGKAHLLRGQVAERRFREREDKDHLHQAARFYTLSLAYDERFAADFRDLRGALRRIYGRLRKLNREEFQAVHEGIAEAVKEYDLEKPTRMDKLLGEYNLPQREIERK